MALLVTGEDAVAVGDDMFLWWLERKLPALPRRTPRTDDALLIDGLKLPVLPFLRRLLLLDSGDINFCVDDDALSSERAPSATPPPRVE